MHIALFFCNTSGKIFVVYKWVKYLLNKITVVQTKMSEYMNMKLLKAEWACRSQKERIRLQQ